MSTILEIPEPTAATVLPALDPARRLAHDLKTPLNGIIGFAQLLRDGKAGPVSAQQQEFLDDILTSASQLLGLVASRLDGKTAPAVPPPAPLAETARPAPAPGPGTAPGRHTSILVVEDDPEYQGWLGRTLAAAGYDVTTAGTCAEALARCHERRYDGITLDLLLPDATGWDVLRGIREGGVNKDVPTVVVSVAPTKVAVAGFVVRTVVTKPASEGELLAALAEAGVRPHDTGPVLVVDNNPAALKLAAKLLAVNGYRAVCCAGGRSALEAAAAEPPVAVLLDLLMPGMSGFEFLDEFRRTPAGRDVPVIVWTIKDLSAEERGQINEAAQAVVEKRGGGTQSLLDTLRAWVPAPRG